MYFISLSVFGDCFHTSICYHSLFSYQQTFCILYVVQIFEVKSTSTIETLCRSIAIKLKVSSAEGYGLYLKTPNKVRLENVPEEVAFFFLAIHYIVF